MVFITRKDLRIMKFKVVKTDNRYEDILIEKDILNKVDGCVVII